MKSTIRVDFRGLEESNGFEPVIAVILDSSDDPRDGLLAAFFQSLGGNSSWIRVTYDRVESKEKYITLRPVKDSELSSELEVMNSRVIKK